MTFHSKLHTDINLSNVQKLAPELFLIQQVVECCNHVLQNNGMLHKQHKISNKGKTRRIGNSLVMRQLDART